MQKYSNLDIYGEIPSENKPEEAQYERVLSILNSNHSLIGPWNKVLIDYKYQHEKGNIIEEDKDWDGQIDLILFSQSRIIIYELKGFTVNIIGGTTSQYTWLVKKKNWDKLKRMDSPFKQVSRQRAHLLNDILVEGIGCDKNHWVVDGRVVFKNESNFKGFWFFPPRTIKEENFQEDFLTRIGDEEDRKILSDFYTDREESTGKLQLKKFDFKKDGQSLRRLFEQYDLPIRTKKWFNLLTENQVISDLENTGSNEFSLCPEDAERIIGKMSNDL